MRRLVHENTATLGFPFSPPRIGLVIGLVAPAKHEENSQHGPADFSALNSGFDPLHRFIKAPLTHHRQPHPGFLRGPQHGIAIGQTGGHRFFHHDMQARLRGQNGRFGVQGMRCANENGLRA